MTEHVYKVGDVVWRAQFAPSAPQTVPCPVCYGKLAVVLTLGNGDEVTMQCDYCGKGNLGVPKGWETVYTSECKAEQVTITRVDITATSEGETREYSCFDRWRIDPADMFPTEAEALARAQEKATAHDAEQEKNSTRQQEYVQKSFAWKAGYHIRQAQRARSDLAYAERMIQVCKAKATPKSLARFGLGE